MYAIDGLIVKGVSTGIDSIIESVILTEDAARSEVDNIATEFCIRVSDDRRSVADRQVGGEFVGSSLSKRNIHRSPLMSPAKAISTVRSVSSLLSRAGEDRPPVVKVSILCTVVGSARLTINRAVGWLVSVPQLELLVPLHAVL